MLSVVETCIVLYLDSSIVHFIIKKVSGIPSGNKLISSHVKIWHPTCEDIMLDTISLLSLQLHLRSR